MELVYTIKSSLKTLLVKLTFETLADVSPNCPRPSLASHY